MDARYPALMAALVASPCLAAPAQQIHSLAAYPTALCNDGTPGAYYLRPSKSGSTRWVFYLEGGGNCDSESTCQTTRMKSYYFTTSTGWNGKSAAGILSSNPTTNPTFFDANIVKVHYCSQDYWSGGTLAKTAFMPGNASTGWSFEGRAIAVAAFQDLAAQNATTNFNAATDILFSGSSAGGLGIVFTINDLLPLAPPAARTEMAVDGGFTLEIGVFNKTTPPNYIIPFNPYDTTIVSGEALWGGHGETLCDQNSGSAAAARTACYNTANILSGTFVTIPVFVAQTELDTQQLEQHRWTGAVNQDHPHMTYATEFADAMKGNLAGTTPAISVFAPQRLTHTFFVTDAEFSTPESFPGTTQAANAALAQWYAQPLPNTRSYGNAAGLP